MTLKPQSPAYDVVNDGFEIVNGPGIYNRYLPGPHCRDRDHFEERLLSIVGDSPNALITLINWRVAHKEDYMGDVKLGHFLPGVRAGNVDAWLDDFDFIKARYVRGHQEYELRTDGLAEPIRIFCVSPVEFEGLLIKLVLPKIFPAGKLVCAFGGATLFKIGTLDYQLGRGSARDFKPADCEGNEISLLQNGFGLRRPQKEHQRTLFAAANRAMHWRIGDASAFGGGPGAALASQPGNQPLVVAACEATPGMQLYLALTTENLSSSSIRACLQNPSPVFEACCRHYWNLSQTTRIETPDKRLDLGFAAQVLAQDAAWHDPTFTHGPWSWTTPYAGWRICYGATVLGWHDRVQSSTAEFRASQLREPEFPNIHWPVYGNYPGGAECRGFILPVARTSKGVFNFGVYNMGEVLVDHALYDWEWTGDLDFMAGMFDFIADKLLWEERCLDADGDGLYENFLNTWGSDAHWYNGGGCIQASVYNWRANKLMAAIAYRLGRDAGVFDARAAKIKAACRAQLWVSDKGIYAEYKDALGLMRRHEAPELASIYLPIDARFCDDFESYQMLRYSEHAIPNETDTVSGGGRLVWSSNWLPPLYSSHGLFPQEMIHLLLCYYRLGLAAQAEALLDGIMASFLAGPCPGAFTHWVFPDGRQKGSTDFTDATSMFLRTIVEGLFGVQMDAPNDQVTVQPCFPRDWKHASIEAKDIACRYTWDGAVESIRISTPRKLRYQVRLMARTSKVTEVKLNGARVSFRLEPGIGRTWVAIATTATKAAEIEITYAPSELPAVEFANRAQRDASFVVKAKHGELLEWRDPQGALTDAKRSRTELTAKVGAEAGWHICFVLTRQNDCAAWLPVDFEVRAPAGNVTRPFDNLPTDASARRNLPWQMVSLADHVNEDLVLLHKREYLDPRPMTYSITVKKDGRSIWDHNASGRCVVNPCVERLKGTGGTFWSDLGVPFAVPEDGRNVVFTSQWRNFPRSVELPIHKRGREVFLLLVASTNPMQSRIENARVSVTLADGGVRELPLINPDNLDDWLCTPYHQSGFTQYLGEKTHAVILNMDLGALQEIAWVRLDCLSNEVLVGLLGTTVL
ncbi:MAG: DUF4450 domain-containing protein [Verrucomicrobia bacterium]|nr:DUF4450 domain-containing protein [Verrucomicrobiota bacterium]